MTTTATLNYTSFIGGATAPELIALMESVPPPTLMLAKLGVRPISAVAAGVGPVIYTVVLGLGPTAAGSGTATLEDAGASGSGVESVAVGAVGSGYVACPVVSFVGGRTILAPDPGFPSEQPVESMGSFSANTPAAAQAYLTVVAASVAVGGSGYSADAVATLIGGVKQGGHLPKLSLTIVGGIIIGGTIVDPGSGLAEMPTVVVEDATGSGAAIALSLGLDSIDVTRKGGGYSSPPTVVLTPLFQALFPVSSDQAQPFRQLMTTALEQKTIGPVKASDPIIA
jgi:hypothetical protein